MKRPMFLTIWLILMTLGAISTAYSYTLGSATIMKAIPNMPSWALTQYALFSIVNLVAVWMLWTWKKMGFNLFVVSAVISASLNGMILGAIGVGSSIFGVVGIVILYLAMKPVWKQFK